MSMILEGFGSRPPWTSKRNYTPEEGLHIVQSVLQEVHVLVEFTELLCKALQVYVEPNLVLPFLAKATQQNTICLDYYWGEFDRHIEPVQSRAIAPAFSGIEELALRIFPEPPALVPILEWIKQHAFGTLEILRLEVPRQITKGRALYNAMADALVKCVQLEELELLIDETPWYNFQRREDEDDEDYDADTVGAHTPY
jgi:hypothetical protein